MVDGTLLAPAARVNGRTPYVFPTEKLQRTMKGVGSLALGFVFKKEFEVSSGGERGVAVGRTFGFCDESKTPLVLVACGSYSPITYLHLRMLEMAQDYVADHEEFEIMGGYFSPVSSAYKKEGLARNKHRVRMCELAVADSDWLMVDGWEAAQPVSQRTAVVMQHFDRYINEEGKGGVVLRNGERRSIRILLIAGGDLIQSFASVEIREGVKVPLDIILGNFGCMIIERTGADVHDFLLTNKKLFQHRKRVYVVKQYIHNDISSTKIRLFIKRNMSVKYLLPDPVIDYIRRHNLYREDEPGEVPPVDDDLEDGGGEDGDSEDIPASGACTPPFEKA
ncbi:hypothetical protein HDU67_004203 [Dinochytrium kinnereticum]|nr:hypothetical protein HDU67_004203 [Dinochytrium kinnereticum]